MTKDKVYHGKRIHNGVEIVVKEEGDAVRLLRCYGFHSPDGFEWGYGGSGPAETALAILLDYFEEAPSPADLYMGDTKAQKLHQDFKWAFIATIDTIEWEISGEEIAAWLDARPASALFGEDVRVLEEEETL